VPSADPAWEQDSRRKEKAFDDGITDIRVSRPAIVELSGKQAGKEIEVQLRFPAHRFFLAVRQRKWDNCAVIRAVYRNRTGMTQIPTSERAGWRM
jgi:hypothetical protein